MARILRANNRYTARTRRVTGILFDDEVDRLSYAPLTILDIGVVAQQLDTREFWILEDLDPPLWVKLGAGSGDFLTKEEHGALGQADFIHTTIALTFPNAATRNGFVGIADDIGKVARQLNDDSLWMLQDLVPTWLPIGTGGGVTSHLALSNLTGAGIDGDAGHSQMVLNTGRSGGQTIPGGTGAAENLVLSSTTDGTKGQVVHEDEARFDADMLMNGDNEFIPAVDGEGSVGVSGARFAEVNAIVVNTGDLRLEDKTKRAAWRIIEEPDKLVVVNEHTKRQYALVLRELDKDEHVSWKAGTSFRGNGTKEKKR